MTTQSDVITSTATFLQTAVDPPRPLQEKISFLIKEKGLSYHDMIAALKKANLYNEQTLEPLLAMFYTEQQNQQKKKKKKKPSPIEYKSPATQNITPNIPPTNPPFMYPPQPQNGWSTWGILGTIGIGITSAIASYAMSTSVTQKLVSNSENEMNRQIADVRQEIREQSDLDRERQHRDLMQVVDLLRDQVQTVKSNLEILKQSIDLVQSQLQYNQNMQQMPAKFPMTTNELQVNRNMSVSDGGRQSSSLDLDSDGRQYSSTAKKVRQPIISKLLRTSDDEEFDWMNDEIEIEPIVKKIDGKVEEKVNSSKKKMQMDDSSNTSSNLSSDHEFLISDENIPEIFREDWLDMIECLPTHQTCKQSIIDILQNWKKIIYVQTLKQERKSKKQERKSKKRKRKSTPLEITIDQLKIGLKALNFFIGKILKDPQLLSVRKINTYNRQFIERVSKLPNIEQLLLNIGYEQTTNAIFYVLPLLYIVKGKKNDDDEEQAHNRQIEFLKYIQQIFSSLFCFEKSLPFPLNVKVANIENERRMKEEEIKVEREEKEKKESSSETNAEISQNSTENNETCVELKNEKCVIANNVKHNENGSKIGLIAGEFNLKFADVARMVANGGIPPDVRTDIEDMPPNPNALPSQSILDQRKKPFECSAVNVNNSGEELDWFEQLSEVNDIVGEIDVKNKDISSSENASSSKVSIFEVENGNNDGNNRKAKPDDEKSLESAKST